VTRLVCKIVLAERRAMENRTAILTTFWRHYDW
jgi:hypothetical protein